MKTTRMAYLLSVTVVAAVLAAPRSVEADAPAGWTDDFAAAQKTAAESKRDILMKFTGSDWCIPCRQLQAAVFETEAFKNAGPKQFVLVYVDFPRNKSKQSPEVVRQNKELSELYKFEALPTVVLADASGRAYGVMEGYGDQTPQQYLSSLEKLRQVRASRDKAFKAAAEAVGVDKARHLHAGLAAIDPALIRAGYEEQVKQVIALDADNAAGLKAFYESLEKLPEIRAEALEIEEADVDAGLKLQRLDKLARAAGAGHAVQEVLFAKARVAFLAEQEQAAKAFLAQAIAAAPQSPRAEEIRRLIAEFFN